MKSITWLSGLFALVIVIASCTSTQNSTGEEYLDKDKITRAGNRVYINDPYYGTVILERDPFTGRYYDVTYGYRNHSSPFPANNYYREFRSYRSYRNNTDYPNEQRPSKEEISINRDEARKKILGN